MLVFSDAAPAAAAMTAAGVSVKAMRAYRPRAIFFSALSPSLTAAFGSHGAGDFLRGTGRTKEEFPLPPFIVITISGSNNEGLSSPYHLVALRETGSQSFFYLENKMEGKASSTSLCHSKTWPPIGVRNGGSNASRALTVIV